VLQRFKSADFWWKVAILTAIMALAKILNLGTIGCVLAGWWVGMLMADPPQGGKKGE
jgi:hypothetical protein